MKDNKQTSKFQPVALGMFLLLMGTNAFAAVTAGDAFYGFYEFLTVNMTGGLGIGIALTAFLIGAGIAAMTSKALPMLAGFVVAGFIAFGPGIITGLISSTTVINVANLI